MAIAILLTSILNFLPLAYSQQWAAAVTMADETDEGRMSRDSDESEMEDQAQEVAVVDEARKALILQEIDRLRRVAAKATQKNIAADEQQFAPRSASWFRVDHTPNTTRSFAFYGKRRDLAVSIEPVLKKWGMKRVSLESGGWDVLWGVAWDGKIQMDNRHKPHKQVNSLALMATETLGLKDKLMKSLRRCVDAFGEEHCDNVPLAFELPGERRKMQDFALSHPQLSWILKPARGWSAKGVRMMKSLSDIPEQGKWVAQRYVKDLMLVHGRKFDFRVWAIITSLMPLRVYLLRESFAKVAPEVYSSEASSFGNLCIHSTTPPKDCDYSLHSSGNLKLHMFQKAFFANITFGGGSEPLKQEQAWRRWNDEIWPSVETAVLKTLLMVWSRHKDWHDRHGDQVFRRFQWLHFDVIVDSDGHAWVEEVNCNGFMMGNHNGYKTLPLQVEGMELAGIRGYDRSRHSDQTKTAAKRFCGGEANREPLFQSSQIVTGSAASAPPFRDLNETASTAAAVLSNPDFHWLFYVDGVPANISSSSSAAAASSPSSSSEWASWMSKSENSCSLRDQAAITDVLDEMGTVEAGEARHWYRIFPPLDVRKLDDYLHFFKGNPGRENVVFWNFLRWEQGLSPSDKYSEALFQPGDAFM